MIVLLCSLHIDYSMKKCLSLSHYAAKLLRKCDSAYVINEFVLACIFPVASYGLPCYVGFFRDNELRSLRRLLKRLATIRNSTRKQLAEKLVSGMLLSAQRLCPIALAKSERRYNTRSTGIVAVRYNKGRTQNLICYVITRPDFFHELLDKLV